MTREEMEKLLTDSKVSFTKDNTDDELAHIIDTSLEGKNYEGRSVNDLIKEQEENKNEDDPITEETVALIEEPVAEETEEPIEGSEETMSYPEDYSMLQEFMRSTRLKEVAASMNMDVSRMEAISKIVAPMSYKADETTIAAELEKALTLFPEFKISTDSSLLSSDEKIMEENTENKKTKNNKKIPTIMNGSKNV